MPFQQSYNPVKIRVKGENQSLRRLDGPDLIFANLVDAEKYIESKHEDGSHYVAGVKVEKLGRTTFVFIPATVGE